MKRITAPVCASLAFALSTAAALAEPALIYDMGGKFDKSFNEAAWNGAERWAKATGGTYREIEITDDAQRETALRRLAEAGANPIVTTGFSMSDPIAKVAPEFPETKFVTIDGWVDPEAHKNVKSVVFQEHEGSYLTGLLAGMASKTGTGGFVGGMDIPLIRNFGCGFAQGFVAARPDAKVIGLYVGTTSEAWNDPIKGSELTRSLKSQGADVVFAAAGQSGVGVLQAAADEKIFSVGVDSNQNHLHAGSVLTSMVKGVDVAVEQAMTAGEGLDTAPSTLGLAENGVWAAMDDNNKALITPEMQAALEKATASIIAGETKVHDYRSDNTCPVAGF